MDKLDPSQIEKKWQEKWEKDRTFSPDIKNAKNPYFNLMMFPYPSAEGLHVGNMYAFTGADVYAKFNRMQGKDVLEPIGLDGFGIHSENYALKVGRHPIEQAQIAEKNFYRQLRSIGNSFDWQRTVETYNPGYYKWTQWLFTQLFKAGLAYRDTALVNWCPKDMTVLSDEQVIDGSCERCGSKVEKKNLEQWFFRITNYADRLLNNIEDLKWTEKVKVAQRNWIGKSTGAEIGFRVKGSGDSEEVIKVFTTRPDTLYGATFMVISPEHTLVEEISNGKSQIPNEIVEEVKNYTKQAKEKTDIERTDEGKEKTGVFSGLYAINPVNNKEIPVWVADYVLAGYGTGAIMAVPAHDTRDFEFAKKYNLEIIQVIQAKDGADKELSEAYVGPGMLINSGEWNGIEVKKEMVKVLDSIEKSGIGQRKANFHLRDWLISRQRYWGPPIPMIFCQECMTNKKGDREEMPGWYCVPDNELPVLLPTVEDWKPMGTGKSPLDNHPEFYKASCPSCGGEAKRETDVSDTFLDSSWYFLRYPSTDVDTEAFDRETTRKWLPVHQYIGGAEHSVLHLLYSRFVTMVLHDLKFIDFDEPFANFFAHGLIIKDGAKMSKSKGNVVVPDEYIAKYGADTLRSYLMFIGPFSDGGDFKDSGIEGMNKFLRKVWKLASAHIAASEGEQDVYLKKLTLEITEEVTNFRYNTAISRLMMYYNFLSKKESSNEPIFREEMIIFIKLLALFAPHMTEELYALYNNSDTESVHLSLWPQVNEDEVKNSLEVILAISINGKTRATMVIDSNLSQADIEAKAKVLVEKNLEGLEVKKAIYVPGKIVNFVAN